MQTQQQIDLIERHLAENVMGWTLSSPWQVRGGFWERNWHPCSNTAHAASVRKKMEEMGWQYVAQGDGHRHQWEWIKDAGKGLSHQGPWCLIESEASSVAVALATGWREESNETRKIQR